MLLQKGVHALEKVQPIRLAGKEMVGQRLFNLDIVAPGDFTCCLQFLRHFA